MITIDVQGDLQADTILRKMAKDLGHTHEEFLDHAGAVALKTVIRNTQPFGLTGKAKKQGENAIIGDLSNAFKVVSNRAGGDSGVISDKAAALAHLARVRNTRRRVGKGSQKRKVIARIFNLLIKEKQDKVGLAKGAWAHSLVLKNAKIQKWITRHGYNGSGTKRMDRRKGGYWLFAGEPEHLRDPNVLGERGLIRSLKWQERNLKTFYRAKLRAKLKAANNKLAK